MKDAGFIQSILAKGQEAKNKVVKEFSDLTALQLNWKPAPQSWSIAECLEHLLIADSRYFHDLQKIISGGYKMTFWEKYSPFTAACGRILKDQLKETVTRKMIAPKKIRPTFSDKPLRFIDQYLNNLSEFLGYIESCSNTDIDKTIITSPTISIVTYSLRDAFQFLMQHEHRHINQAMRVKMERSFP